MERKEQTSNEYFKLLTGIHVALLLGQLLFLVVCFVLIDNEELYFDFNVANIHILLVPFLMFSGIVASHFLGKQKDKTSSAKSNLHEKLFSYRTSLIVKLALVEGPNLFAIVAFLISDNFLFAVYAGIGIIYFFSMRPTKMKTIKELELNKLEQEKINEPSIIVTTL